jgi:hypothetical protein
LTRIFCSLNCQIQHPLISPSSRSVSLVTSSIFIMAMNLRLASLWFSMLHAVFVLTCIPLALYWQVAAILPELQNVGKDGSPLGVRDLASGVLERLAVTQPNFLAQLIACVAGTYYVTDLVMTLGNVHPLSFNVKAWFTLHHIFCFIGLVWPTLVDKVALDSFLALGGFWVGEISNPPRCLVDILQAEIDVQVEKHEAAFRRRGGRPDAKPTPLTQVNVPFWGIVRIDPLKKFMASSQNFHVILFVIFRFVGTQYMFQVVWPYAMLKVTNVCGIVTLILSLIALVVMFTGGTPPATNQEPKAVAGDVAQTDSTSKIVKKPAPGGGAELAATEKSSRSRKDL